MKLNIQEMSDFIVAQKPSGWNTHASDHGRIGFVEFIKEELSQPLWVVQRLDKETSGLILFAKSEESAEKFRIIFEKHDQIKKEYYFLTDRPYSQTADKIVIRSQIEKNKKTFTSSQPQITVGVSDLTLEGSHNALSIFEFQKKVGNYFLWKAEILTGKSHQIRLHAQDLGISLLGDLEHGGSPFFRLCLHAASLSFQWNNETLHLTSPAPLFFQEEFSANSQKFSAKTQSWILQFFCEWHYRQMLWKPQEQDSFRVAHQIGGESELVDLDCYGSILWAYWFGSQEPTEDFKTALSFFGEKIFKKTVLRWMINRGADPNTNYLKSSQEIPSLWEAQENTLKFQLKTDSGLSPGLFLDQRENRNWVFKNSQNKKVLNLFAYTGVFGVAAALGGAQQVTTVDLSKRFIEWSQQNFKLNITDSEKLSTHEFLSLDTFIFLKGAFKRHRTFDLIICDPPSFSRSKEGVFKIEKDIFELWQLIWQVLAPGGTLLFTTNFEQWDAQKVLTHWKQWSQQNKSSENVNYKVIKTLRSSFDFEKPDEDTLMKGFLIQRLK
jgi:23S rRNA (cytosine1962-C5)-methyltransferase